MAVVSFIKTEKQTKGSLSGIIKYVSQNIKTLLQRELLGVSHTVTHESNANDPTDESCVRLLSGKDCCAETAFQEFMSTKNSYGKVNGVFFYQYTQSFKDGENISPRTAHEIAMKFAEDNYKGYEVIVATHIDNEHLHSHFIINSVSFETGKKLHQPPDTIKRLRAYSDEVCKSYGLSVLEPYVRGKTKTLSSREFRAAMKGQSWKIKLMTAIDGCMDVSRGKEEFVKNMLKLGYGVKWSDTRKSITYQCPNNQSCRGDKLHEDKYLKGNMENEFRIRTIEATEPTGYFCPARPFREDPLHGNSRTMEQHNRSAVEKLQAVDGVTGTVEGFGNGGYDGRLQQHGDASSQGQDISRNPIDRQNSKSNPSQDGEPVITGWELSRGKLEVSERNDEYDYGTVQAVTTDILPQADVVSVAGNIGNGIISLAYDISKIIDDEPLLNTSPTNKPTHSSAEKEKRKALGQKDDEEQSSVPNLSM
jgi:hypothetical protein